MELEILKSSKDEIEVRLPNITLVEILRVYLNKDDSVSFAAWKREHPLPKTSVGRLLSPFAVIFYPGIFFRKRKSFLHICP